MAELSRVYDQQGKVIAGNIPSQLTAEEIKKRQEAAKPFVAKGVAATGMPKQEPGESMSSFSTRMRLFREAKATPAEEGQRKALKKLAQAAKPVEPVEPKKPAEPKKPVVATTPKKPPVADET